MANPGYTDLAVGWGSEDWFKDGTVAFPEHAGDDAVAKEFRVAAGPALLGGEAGIFIFLGGLHVSAGRVGGIDFFHPMFCTCTEAPLVTCVEDTPGDIDDIWSCAPGGGECGEVTALGTKAWDEQRHIWHFWQHFCGVCEAKDVTDVGGFIFGDGPLPQVGHQLKDLASVGEGLLLEIGTALV